MAEKDTGKHELGVAVGVIGIVVAVIGAVAGLAQLQPVRDFVCAQGSVLCKRDHVLHFFKMSYTQSPPLPAEEHADPWMILLNNISDTTAYFSAIGRSNANTDCVDDPDLSYYLIHHALYSSSAYTVVSGNSTWTFDTAPIDTHNTINLLPGDSLIFFLGSRYTRLVRNLTLTMDVTVEDEYHQYPKYTVRRSLMLPKGSREKDIFCKLFFPEAGNFTFRFSFRDDIWDADDPIEIPLSITLGGSNK